jgi:aarF domain-containing kinase
MIAPNAAYYLYYELALSSQEKRKVRVNIKSVGRAIRSFKEGAITALDYKWNLWRIDEVQKKKKKSNSFSNLPTFFCIQKDSEEYTKIIKECHLRAANRMVKTCIQNGGLYVKIGQGASTMNHVLPKEFYVTLRRLQSEAIRSEGNEV